MLWTVILGSEEWKDLAKVSRVDVEMGRLDRIAVCRTGRSNCRAAWDIGVLGSGGEEREKASVGWWGGGRGAVGEF